jgi:hypothetical protein
VRAASTRSGCGLLIVAHNTFSAGWFSRHESCLVGPDNAPHYARRLGFYTVFANQANNAVEPQATQATPVATGNGGALVVVAAAAAEEAAARTANGGAPPAKCPRFVHPEMRDFACARPR